MIGLILILMSLNPYSNGSTTMGHMESMKHAYNKSLNPYSNGSTTMGCY